MRETEWTPAQRLFRQWGIVQSIRAVRAGRKYLYGVTSDQVFPRDEVKLIVQLEALHIAVEDFAAVVKDGIEKELEAKPDPGRRTAGLL